jgi:hypothetical protein
LYGDPIAWDVRDLGSHGIQAAHRPFEAVAFTWLSTAEARVRVRVSAENGDWSEWIELAIDDDVTSRADRRYATAITHFGAAMRSIEYSFEPAVTNVTMTLFVPAPRNEDRYSISSFQFGDVTVRSRVDWGCPDGEGSRWTPAFTPITHAVVHHTAGSNSLTNWEAEVRNIWQFHTISNGWGDIGYNFLIDPNGVVYEGRAGGDGALGAHFSCRNTNTVGVSLMGTFTNVAPTDAALRSLKLVLAEIVRRHHINPTDVVLHVPSGLTVPTIIGHRDGNTSPLTCTRTECPGEILYAMLPSIRADLACEPVSIDVAPASVSVPAATEVTLSVTARGSGPFAYQWYRGASRNTDSPIEGATESSVRIVPSATSSYWVRLTNACSSVDSGAATINITTPGRRRATR